MKFIKAYDIDVIRLKDGTHSFDFEIGNAFFEYFQAEDWLNGADLKVDATLKKTVSVMEVDFRIHGTINLTCDRSLETFDYPFDRKETVVYKYGPIEQEISEDVFMITRDTPSVNIAQLVYEFILLGIPAKKIHPDYLDEKEDEDESEGDFVYLSEEQEEDSPAESGEENSTDRPADPVWDILKQLKQKE